MTKTIEIVVSTTGETTVQTQGFTGASCQAASRFIEQALGKRIGEQLTGEFYQTTTHQQVRQEGSA